MRLESWACEAGEHGRFVLVEDADNAQKVELADKPHITKCSLSANECREIAETFLAAATFLERRRKFPDGPVKP